MKYSKYMEPTVLDHLLHVSELFQRDMARAFEGTRLTPTRVQALWVLQHGGPATQRELASAMSISARHISGIIDVLEADGYVVRTPHPRDRRATVIELTDTAAAQMATMQREHSELAATLLDAVAPSDRAALERGVAAIAGRLAELVEAAQPAGESAETAR